jgi:hypothetical protein
MDKQGRFSTLVILVVLPLAFSLGCGKSTGDGTSAPADGAASDKAWIKAEPNPVPAGTGPGKTTVKWNTGDGSNSQVYLEVAGQPDTLFSTGPRGEAEAPWISKGSAYHFVLYAGTSKQRALAKVTVTRE